MSDRTEFILQTILDRSHEQPAPTLTIRRTDSLIGKPVEAWIDIEVGPTLRGRGDTPAEALRDLLDELNRRDA